MQLEQIERLRPAAYNPRSADPRRLDLVELSLRKLGWLLPVYATEDGEILSGHQRVHVAPRLRYREVPVVRVRNMPDHVRKAVNILFNRSTNDMDIDSVPQDLTRELARANVWKLAESLPDYPIDHFPCLEGRQREIGPYLKANTGRWIPYALAVSKTLWGHRILMPIIVTRDGLVVNGIGRLQMLGEKRMGRGLFVEVGDAEARFAEAMLNLLSMDFDVKRTYSDLLRYNSFRRARRVRHELGQGFTIFAFPELRSKDVDLGREDHRRRWIHEHGRCVLDFGAGHLQETEMLRAAGIRVTPFEPYRMGETDRIDRAGSVALTREFLLEVAAGTVWDSIFISSVLNSVPFQEDREKIVRILAALAGDETRVYAVASSDRQTGWTTLTKKWVNERAQTQGSVQLDYESRVVLSDLAEMPKVQKYHTPQDLYDLFKTGFWKVKAGYADKNAYVIAKGSRGIERLKEALEFEFDLPYPADPANPDGGTMGLARDAVRAFERRLGVGL